MANFTITKTETQSIPIFVCNGYFNAEAGAELHKQVDEALDSGKLKVIIDFTPCSVINSPGIGSMLDLTFKVLDDFQGTLILFGFDDLQLSMMTMAGILPLAQVADNREAALKALTSAL